MTTVRVPIKIVNGSIQVDAEFEASKNDLVIFEGDTSLGRWVVGFTGPGDDPFKKSKRFFSNVGAGNDSGIALNLGEHKFWIFCEIPGNPITDALFMDPKLVIRDSGMTNLSLIAEIAERLAELAAEMERLRQEAAELEETARILNVRMLPP